MVLPFCSVKVKCQNRQCFTNVTFNMLHCSNPEEFMGVLRHQCIVFIFIFNIPICYENKILGQEVIKQRFSFYQLNNNIG